MSLTDFYTRLPVWLQNAAVSAYGILREHRRYGGDFKDKLRFFIGTEKRDEAYIRDYQGQQLKKLFIKATESSYYKRLFQDLGIDAEKDDSYGVLKKIPVLNKQRLRSNEAEFITERLKSDQIFHTSGSTGTPLNVRMGIEDFRERMAILERMKICHGVTHKSRHISFVGKKISSGRSHVFWRYNLFGHQLVMSVYDLSRDNRDIYLHKIIKYNPEMIEGYPSALVVIAKWLKESGQKINLRCVLVTAETLTAEQRGILETAFECPVINYYGSTEGAPVISQCECGHLHLNYESGIIEFLDLNGLPAQTGTVSRMIVTSFLTKSMPLIRYDINDMAVVSGEPCPCGRHTPVIREIVGRCDDVFETPEKGFVGRLSTSLKLLPDTVRRAQLQQKAPESFVLLLETENRLSDAEKTKVLNDLLDKLGKVSVDIQYTSEIPVGANGKFRSQIKY